MPLGIIQYDKEGRPICEICGKGFHRLMSHTRQTHNMSAYDYKKTFGLCTTKGIISKKSQVIARERVLENYTKCVKQNLLKGGKSTRFQKGCQGRTRDQVCEQTKIIYAENFIKMDKRKQQQHREKCAKLGKSGLGAQARYAKKGGADD